MNIVIDTSVWSLVLRRGRVDEANQWVKTFRSCVETGHYIFLLGPILQELLTGVRTAKDFDRLIRALRPFPLLPLERETFVLAAQINNQCRSRGSQAGHVDYLIAAACIENACPLLTADRDFTRITERTELMVMPPAEQATTGNDA